MGGDASSKYPFLLNSSTAGAYTLRIHNMAWPRTDSFYAFLHFESLVSGHVDAIIWEYAINDDPTKHAKQASLYMLSSFMRKVALLDSRPRVFMVYLWDHGFVLPPLRSVAKSHQAVVTTLQELNLVHGIVDVGMHVQRTCKETPLLCAPHNRSAYAIDGCHPSPLIHAYIAQQLQHQIAATDFGAAARTRSGAAQLRLLGMMSDIANATYPCNISYEGRRLWRHVLAGPSSSSSWLMSHRKQGLELTLPLDVAGQARRTYDEFDSMVLPTCSDGGLTLSLSAARRPVALTWNAMEDVRDMQGKAQFISYTAVHVAINGRQLDPMQIQEPGCFMKSFYEYYQSWALIPDDAELGSGSRYNISLCASSRGAANVMWVSALFRDV